MHLPEPRPEPQEVGCPCSLRDCLPVVLPEVCSLGKVLGNLRRKQLSQSLQYDILPLLFFLFREDAEAPKARLVKPSSSSSGSQSSRSGSSCTRSTANSASRSQRTLSPETAPPPGLATRTYILVGPEARGSEPKRVHHAPLAKAESTASRLPSQSRPLQTV